MFYNLGAWFHTYVNFSCYSVVDECKSSICFGQDSMARITLCPDMISAVYW